MKTIVFTGGGTAGHITPNLAIINELKNYKIVYIGSNGMEKELVAQHPNITFIEIPAVKLIRSLHPKNALIPFKLIRSINTTKKILKALNPCLIFSKGGYVSIPVCIAGKTQKIPIITHESDYTIGLANKIIAKISQKICCSFETTANKYGKNAIYTGSPIRKEIFHGNKNVVKTRHSINTTLPIVLIVGGSLGAQTINQTIWNNINKICSKYFVIHITGKKNTNTKIKHKNYIQIPFANDIENYFHISDIIISRAGSNTIFEILAIAKPMILIPLPKSTGSRGDQELNANYFQEKGYAQVIKQQELNVEKLLSTLNYVIKNKHKYVQSMKNNQISGTEQIIKLIENTIK